MQGKTVGKNFIEAIVLPAGLAGKDDPGGWLHELAQYL
jgi:hypothetical protein